jgi:outer membrane protein OmpA-like peptidoglycan-associated protein
VRKLWITAVVVLVGMTTAAPSFALEKGGMIGFGLSAQGFKWLLWGGDDRIDPGYIPAGDNFTLGGIGRVNVEYGLMDKLTLGLTGGYGRIYVAEIDTADPGANAGFTLSNENGGGYVDFIPIQLYGKYSFMTGGSVSPYAKLGAGILMYKAAVWNDTTNGYETVPYITADGTVEEWSGMDLTPFAGLGIEFFMAENFCFDFGISAHYMTGALNTPASDIDDNTDSTYAPYDREYGMPQLLAGIDLGFMYYFGRKDADGDGVVDKIDQCPDTPVGAVVDEYGCPIDSDGDGVYDGLDTCPDTPYGAVVDPSGCPMDSDGDDVYDGIDNCADTPAGVKVDEYGCALDNDKDGVPDHLDQCPNTPKGAIVDNNGCPLDSDSDGVYDGLDKCPNTPAGVTVDETGCPTAPEVKTIEVAITFRSGSSDIDPVETAKLQQALQIMKDYPDTRWEVAGHTDSVGSARKNKSLSQRRADSVRTWLMSQGIAADRLVAVGYGEDQPKYNNRTRDGRAMNRRIEFKLIQ